MIDALIYGMMPSAKIVTFARLPPVNMSYRPNMLFLPSCWANSSSARMSTPGVTMRPPMR